MTNEAPQFFYCLRHHRVEGPVGCKAKDRLGPYATEDEARNALQKVKERNAAWTHGGDDD